MTPSKCPRLLECREVLAIVERCLSENRSVLDAPVVEDVINTCAACCKRGEIASIRK